MKTSTTPPSTPGFYFVRRKPVKARKWHPWQFAEVIQRPRSLIAHTLEYPAGFHLTDPTLGKMEWSERIGPPSPEMSIS